MTRTRAILLAVVPGLMLLTAPAVHAQQATQPAAASQSQPALTTEQWLAKAEEAAAAGNYPAAVEAYKKVVAAEPNNLDVRVSAAEAMLKTDNQVQAKEYYEACMKLNPNDWRVHSGLGTLYLQRSYYPLAKPYLERAAELAPARERSRVLVNLAITFSGLHQPAEAIDRARRALVVDPSNLDARRALIALHVEADRLDDAVAENRAALDVIRKALAAQPDDRRSVGQLVECLARESELLQRKMATQPEDVAARLQLVDVIEQQALAAQQMVYHQSLDLLKPVLPKAPDNVDLLLAHARLLYLVGRRAEAAGDLHKVLTLSPDNVQARRLLEKVEPGAQTTQPAAATQPAP